MAEDYYIILGVAPGAGPEEIKRAYRRKVMELHPDHYGEDAGPFLEVQEAYTTLSDPARRQAYDRSIAPRIHASPRGIRSEQTRHHAAPIEPIGPVKRPIARGEISLTQSFEGSTPSFEEIFDRLWASFTGTPRPKSETAEALTVDVPVPFEEAACGGSVCIMVPAEVECPTCRGHGGAGFFECWKCAGHGRITGDFPVNVRLPPGISDGYTVTVPLTRLGIQNLYLAVRFYVV